MSGRRYLDENHEPNVGVYFSVPPDLYDLIKQNAKELGVTTSEFCRTAVKDLLRRLTESTVLN